MQRPSQPQQVEALPFFSRAQGTISSLPLNSLGAPSLAPALFIVGSLRAAFGPPCSNVGRALFWNPP